MAFDHKTFQVRAWFRMLISHIYGSADRQKNLILVSDKEARLSSASQGTCRDVRCMLRSPHRTPAQNPEYIEQWCDDTAVTTVNVSLAAELQAL